MPIRHQTRVQLVIRRDQDRKLDKLAERSGKTRSEVVRDAIDRLLSPPIPDAEEASGTHHTE